jgi:hypothetical protein
MRTILFLGRILPILLVASHTGPSLAQAPNLDVKIEIRVLDFIAEPIGRSDVAVLYDRDVAGSMADALQIVKAFDDSLGLARSKLLPKLVELHALPQEAGLKAVVVGRNIADPHDDILRYGIANRTLVMSAGLDCVRNRHCMVGVAASPEPEIGVMSDIIRRSGIRFADGLQLMVKEY